MKLGEMGPIYFCELPFTGKRKWGQPPMEISMRFTGVRGCQGVFSGRKWRGRNFATKLNHRHIHLERGGRKERC